MIERLISFAAPGDGGYGAVVLEGEAAAGYFAAEGDEPTAFHDAVAGRGEGTLRIGSEAGDLVLGLVAQTTPLGFETGEGRSVTAQAIGVSAEGPGAAGLEGIGVSWTIAGESDQGALRTCWSALADESLFVLFALRPAEAADHAAETVGAARIGKDGSVVSYAEPLLSTEYDAAGHHTRATLELWGAEEGMPERGAGNRTIGGAARLGAGHVEAAGFGWRLEGSAGVGGYEIYSAS